MTTETFTVEPQLVTSIADAQARASFRILVPSSDADIKFVKGAYYVRPGKESDPLGADWVLLFFGSDDRTKGLSIQQGNCGGPLPMEGTPADAHGRVTIQGKEAIWVDGVPREFSLDPFRASSWERGMLSVLWEHSEDATSRLPRMCVLKSTLLTLDELRDIAESLK